MASHIHTICGNRTNFLIYERLVCLISDALWEKSGYKSANNYGVTEIGRSCLDSRVKHSMVTY